MKKSLLLLSLLFTSHLIFAQTGHSWVSESSFPGSGRGYGVAFSIGNYGYMGTGYDYNTIYSDMWQYDAVANSWSQVASMPVGREGAVAFAIGSKGYVGLGDNSGNFNTVLNDFYQYDPAQNSWTPIAQFPGAGRSSGVAFAIGSAGYVTGGENGFTMYNDVYAYDTLTGWSRKNNFPGLPRILANAFSIGSNGYVGAGVYNNYYSFFAYLNDFYQYNPANDSWVQEPNIPFAGGGRAYAVGFGLLTKGYIGAGITSQNSAYNDMYEFDPSNSTWARATDYPGNSRVAATGFAIGDNGYIGFGGAQLGGNTTDFYAYKTCSSPNTPQVYIYDYTSTSLCPGINDSVKFYGYGFGTGNNPVYTWYLNGVKVDTGQNYTVYNPHNNDTVICTMYSNGACAYPEVVSSAPEVIIINPIVTPSITITPSDTSICAGNFITFNSSAINGGSSPTYEWYQYSSYAGYAYAAGSSASLQTYLNNGDSVYLVLTSSAQCVTNTTATSNKVVPKVVQYVSPQVSVQQSASQVCAGDTVHFSATPTNGGTSPTYQWYWNGNLINDSTGHTVTVQVTGSYEYMQVQMTSNAQCLSYNPANGQSTSIIVPATVTPTVTFYGGDNYVEGYPVCPGTIYNFYANPNDGGYPYTLQWTINGQPVPDATGYSFSTDSLKNNDTVNVVITSQAFCTTQLTATGTPYVAAIKPVYNPTFTISNPIDSICYGMPDTFFVQVQNIADPNDAFFDWIVNGNYTGNSSGSSISGNWVPNSYDLSSGENIVSATMYVYNECTASGSSGPIYSSNSDSIYLNYTYAPYLYNFYASSSYACQGSSLTYTAYGVNGGPNASYKFTVNGVTAQLGPQSTFTPDSVNNNDQVQVTYYGTGPCSNPDSVVSNIITTPVYQPTTPTITVTTDNGHLCANGSSDYGSFRATYTGGGSDPYFIWYKNGNYYTEGSGYSVISMNGVQNGDVVSCSLYGSNACTQPYPVTAYDTVVVYQIVQLNVNVNGPATKVCSGNPLLFIATAQNGGDNPVYQWYVDGVAAGTNSDTFVYTDNNLYNYINCYVTSSAMCSNPSATSSNYVYPYQYVLPYSYPPSRLYENNDYNNTSGQYTACTGTSLQLHCNNVPGGIDNYVLFKDSCGGTPVNIIPPANYLNYTVSTDTPGTHTYYLRQEGPCDTTACLTLTINVVPGQNAPDLVANGPTTLCNSDTLILSTDSSAPHFLWSFFDYSNGTHYNLADTTPSIVARLYGQYTLVATNNYSCSASSAPVEVDINQYQIVDVNDFTVNGYAQYYGTISPTDGYIGEWGSAWQNDSIDLNADFNLSFTGLSYGYSDGFAFIFQDSSLSLQPGTGNPSDDAYYNNGGFAHSFAVVFDLPNSTVSIAKNADGSNLLAGPTPDYDPMGGALNSYYYNTFRLQWNHTTHTFNVYQNERLIATYTGDIVNNIFGGKPFVHWGYAATSYGDYDSYAMTVNYMTTQPYIISSGTTSLCAGQNDTLTASSGASYLWSDGETTQGIVVTQAGQYNVTVYDANGCSGHSDSISIATNTLVVNLGNDTSICSGSSLTLDAGNTGGTYLWSDGTTNETISIDTTGTYSVTVTAALGCMSTGSIHVSVNSVARVSLGNDTAICNGNSLTLDAGNAGATYNWSDNSNGETLFVTEQGTYNVTVTAPGGCVSTGSINVSVNALPVVALGNDTAICSGNSVTLNAGNVGATYLWSNTSTNQTLAVSTNGSYSVKVTNANGCSASDTINVSINALPVVNLGRDTAICNGSSVILNAGNAGSTYLWSNTSTNQTLAVSTNGSYSVKVTNANGCSASDTINVSINALPIVNLGRDTAICTGNSVILNAGNAGASYHWSTNATSQTIAASTNGSYSVTVTNNTGCKAADTINVSVNSLPVVNLGHDTTVCGSLTLNAGNAGSTYHWSTSATTQTISASATGNYSVTVTTAGGCRASDTVHVTATSTVTPTISILTAQTTHICAGTNVIFSASITNGGSAPHYQWQLNGGNVGTNSATYSNNNLHNGDVVFCTLNSNATCASPATVASRKDTIVVTPAVGMPGAISGNTSICKGQQTLTYSVAAVAGATSYIWTLPAHATGTSTTNSINVTFASTFTGGSICVKASNSCGNSGNSCTTISVISNKPAAPASITGPTAACASTTQVYTCTSVTGATSYTWTAPVNATILSGQGSNSVTVSFGAAFTSGTLSVKASNCVGASASTNLNISAAIPPVPASITGPINGVCGGSTQNYHCLVASTGSGVSYTWVAPAGATILTGQGTTTVSIRFPAGFSTGVVSVKANGSCGSSALQSITVNSVPATPVDLDGATTNLCGGGTFAYSVHAATGATSYTWTIPAGCRIIGNSSGTSISLNIPSTFVSGNLCIVANNACGSSSSICTTLSAMPATPAITGPTSVCAGSRVNFSAQSTGMSVCTWTVPTGSTITSGQGTANIKVNWGHTSGNVTVHTNNKCGSSATVTRNVSIANCKDGGEEDTSTIAGIEQPDANGVVGYEVKLMPNPSHDVVAVIFNAYIESRYSLQIFDVAGSLVLNNEGTTVAGENKLTININEFSQGIYLVRIISNENAYKTVRLMKQ